ncbi:oxidoreductase [Paractinoplanes ferrugineus]|uniref:Short-chain dehydrogenase n=1 Tax=Paractinoplanes ferrugineus TaxID=113564 RepID=A0A919JBI2_9ACTN|nr:oxidoreductase [Actinoplanes ferrugineus]GIE16254.1 short-chain dehydrogenase [Actinoplanes ferrugineus]
MAGRPTESAPLAGVTAVVTGANSGIGYHTALGLARRGAHVTLVCRDRLRADEARRSMLRAAPAADLKVALADLSVLASVRELAAALSEQGSRLDLLVNNAGIMGGPRRLSPDGYELQFATNYLGHFALTGLLCPALYRSHRPRVVSLISLSTRMVKAPAFDPTGTGYDKFGAYNQSKLANLMFAQELDRRAGPAGLTSVAAHPGFADTEIQFKGVRLDGGKGERPLRIATALLAQSASAGAEAVLHAATAPGVVGGAVYGPTGLAQMRGRPGEVAPARAAADAAAAARLFDMSEELTGVSFGLAAAH